MAFLGALDDVLKLRKTHSIFFRHRHGMEEPRPSTPGELKADSDCDEDTPQPNPIKSNSSGSFSVDISAKGFIEHRKASRSGRRPSRPSTASARASSSRPSHNDWREVLPGHKTIDLLFDAGAVATTVDSARDAMKLSDGRPFKELDNMLYGNSTKGMASAPTAPRGGAASLHSARGSTRPGSGPMLKESSSSALSPSNHRLHSSETSPPSATFSTQISFNAAKEGSGVRGSLSARASLRHQKEGAASPSSLLSMQPSYGTMHRASLASQTSSFSNSLRQSAPAILATESSALSSEKSTPLSASLHSSYQSGFRQSSFVQDGQEAQALPRASITTTRRIQKVTSTVGMDNDSATSPTPRVLRVKIPLENSDLALSPGLSPGSEPDEFADQLLLATSPPVPMLKLPWNSPSPPESPNSGDEGSPGGGPSRGGGGGGGGTSPGSTHPVCVSPRAAVSFTNRVQRVAASRFALETALSGGLSSSALPSPSMLHSRGSSSAFEPPAGADDVEDALREPRSTLPRSSCRVNSDGLASAPPNPQGATSRSRGVDSPRIAFSPLPSAQPPPSDRSPHAAAAVAAVVLSPVKKRPNTATRPLHPKVASALAVVTAKLEAADAMERDLTGRSRPLLSKEDFINLKAGFVVRDKKAEICPDGQWRVR